MQLSIFILISSDLKQTQTLLHHYLYTYIPVNGSSPDCSHMTETTQLLDVFALCSNTISPRRYQTNSSMTMYTSKVHEDTADYGRRRSPQVVRSYNKIRCFIKVSYQHDMEYELLATFHQVQGQVSKAPPFHHL